MPTTQAVTNVVRADEGAFAAPGATLYRRSIGPAGPAPAGARLAIVHGYGDHAGRYDELMTWLARRGVACHAVDLRGHGRSTGRRAYVARWGDYLDDLRAFLHIPELRDAPGQPPLFLMGHSHGGLIVAAAGVRKLLPAHIAGCVLSAPYFVNRLRVPAVKVAAAHVLNAIVPWLKVASGMRPEMMSGDARLVEASRNDPLLVHGATPRWFVVHRPVQADVRARAVEFTRPLLVLYGDADPIADPRGALEFHARAGSSCKAIIGYPGFRHEPLREAGRERVFADVLAWIERVKEEG